MPFNGSVIVSGEAEWYCLGNKYVGIIRIKPLRAPDVRLRFVRLPNIQERDGRQALHRRIRLVLGQSFPCQTHRRLDGCGRIICISMKQHQHVTKPEYHPW